MAVLLTIFTAAVLPFHADNYPDISKLDKSYVLSSKQQFFSRPGSGFVLISTDSVKETLITLLDKDGNPDDSVETVSTSEAFAYEKSAVSDNCLYLVGKAPTRDDCIKISRFSMTNNKLVTNEIDDVSCDFTRGFSANSDGTFSLVTVPYGTAVNSDSPVWTYIFDSEHEDAHCVGAPASNPDSSASSSTDSSESSGVFSAASSSTSSSSQSDSSTVPSYIFSTPVTVDSLQKQLDSEGHGAELRVTAADGTSIESGNVGTGSTVEVLLNGQVSSRIIAVIPGDLVGTGIVTEQDGSLMYDHITNQKELTGLFLKAADLNGDGKINTSDLLKIKSLIK